MTDNLSDQPFVAIDPAWPKVSLADATAALTAPGGKFEIDVATIRGIPTRIWKHAPADLGVLLDLSRTHGERLATILDDERVSFEAQYRATAALAEALVDRGIGKGDRIAFATRNLPEWPVIFFAIVSIGAIAVPLNAWWTGDELSYGIRDSGARLVIVDAERYARLAAHRTEMPGVREWIVARSAEAIDGATALETLIGRPANWAALPDGYRPHVS